MRTSRTLQFGQIAILVLALAALLRTAPLAGAQDGQHLTVTQPGGLPGVPVMTGIQQVTNGVSVSWYGPLGYYQLFRKLGLNSPTWQAASGLTLSNRAIVSAGQASGFFRVSGPSPQYAGAQSCLECHADTHASVKTTPHAGAFTNVQFVALGGQTNSSCLACHTVGFGLPTGFTTKAKTPHLAGVQCENCHGPAARHAANPEDFTVRPRLEIASTVCGGCHTAKSVPAQVAASHPARYEDWNSSPHRAVLPELQADFASDRGPTVYIPTCGRCHSGSVREAFLEETPLPNGHEAGAIGIACSTCHDPHSKYVHTNVLAGVQSFTNLLTGFRFRFTNTLLGVRYTNQLREPLASLKDYHTSGDFVTNYDAQINVCAQCHNDRGASVSGNDRPPHHSPQYNMLLGTVGGLENGLPPNWPSAHSRIEKQCVSCHMPTDNHESGHKFAVTSFESCATCHGSAASAQGFVVLIQGLITSLSVQVKEDLDDWALYQAPAEIRKYGALAWEYQNAGQLSNPSGTLSGPVSNRTDPSKDEQKYIPANIRNARYNLYLVVNDGSLGVHNGPYAISLLTAAQNWVRAEMNE